MTLGLYITEEKLFIKCNDNDNIREVPIALCRTLDNMSWAIGRKAYELSLAEKGIIVDKLFNMLEKKFEATILNYKYNAQNLINIFFQNLFIEYGNIDFVTISSFTDKVVILNSIKNALTLFFQNENKYKIITHEDAFINFVLKMDDSLLNKTVGLVEFSNNSLVYYEINRINLYGRNNPCYNITKNVHEPISIELLEDKTGIIVCDSLLTTFAEKFAKNKNYSSLFLCGSGFKNFENYRDFMEFSCRVSPKVYQEENLLAISAFNTSMDIINNVLQEDITIIDNSRTDSKIFINAIVNQIENSITLVDIGEEWFNKSIEFDAIVYDEDEISFHIDRIGDDEKTISFQLSKFDLRENRTTKLTIKIQFIQKNLIRFVISDNGFGDFYERTDNIIIEEVPI